MYNLKRDHLGKARFFSSDLPFLDLTSRVLLSPQQYVSFIVATGGHLSTNRRSWNAYGPEMSTA